MDGVFDFIIRYIRLIRVADVVDILLVTVIVYYIITLLRDTRALQVAKGLVVILAAFFLSRWLKLNVVNYILGGIIQIGVFAVVVIFQPEIRNLLERIGRFKIGKIIDFASDTDDNDMQLSIDSIAKAAYDMSLSRTGALIVVERGTRLGNYINSGIVLEANVSSSILENIFVPNTPLHDGAVIVRGNKIMAAGCLLPLTANNNLARDLGTRHRAAIGLTESTDAVVVVVSEETGKISLAKNGELARGLTKDSLTRALKNSLLQKADSSEKIEKIKFWRSGKNEQ